MPKRMWRVTFLARKPGKVKFSFTNAFVLADNEYEAVRVARARFDDLEWGGLFDAVQCEIKPRVTGE